ncbi:YybH family protein [Pseudomarimonas arenosa]|uniref:Nuclear transport factor 2 family protein n=1 Tax=Pseudomarimonas arenosa TaxID=2774145 RepID=A0AAW3ZJ98_9GAMM|nr:nuclear transport factor 2 family protein [Pseudomarimonas arenosa]MBD8524391.1 nuclear transport factor 2 family protein [Pseudomarimonas arenosa]
MTRLLILIASLFLLSGANAASALPDADEAAVKAVLAAYKSALERRDLAGTEALFADHNVVAESGKLEGSYRDYIEHHIGPELGHFSRFAFSDYVVRVEGVGDVAWATETYRYVIELKDRAEPIERQGLSTTVLQRLDGEWRIRSMHSSSRAPKPAAP